MYGYFFAEAKFGQEQDDAFYLSLPPSPTVAALAQS